MACEEEYNIPVSAQFEIEEQFTKATWFHEVIIQPYPWLDKYAGFGLLQRDIVPNVPQFSTVYPDDVRPLCFNSEGHYVPQWVRVAKRKIKKPRRDDTHIVSPASLVPSHTAHDLASGERHYKTPVEHTTLKHLRVKEVKHH
jgi:hypothetical protein